MTRHYHKPIEGQVHTRVTLIAPGASASTYTALESDPTVAQHREAGWTDYREPWHVAICKGCARAISDLSGDWLSPEGKDCPGAHQADAFQSAGGYTVVCAAGCKLGTSRVQPDLEGAQRRIRTHEVATRSWWATPEKRTA